MIASALLLALLSPVTIGAVELEVNNIYYRINGDHAVVTSGIYPYMGDVAIPDSIVHDGQSYPVTAIDNAAFRNCTALTGISIPNSIEAIGEHAFAGVASILCPRRPIPATAPTACSYREWRLWTW